MATVKLYLDKRNPRRDGTCPLKVMVNDKSRTCFIKTAVYLLPEHWDSRAARVTGRPDKATLNRLLFLRRQEVEDVVIRLVMSGDTHSLSISEIKERIEEELLPDELKRKDRTRLFAHNFLRFADLHAGRTREIYMTTYKRLQEFAGERLEELAFGDVTVEWLALFEQHLSKHSPSRNARNIHLRNIRAVFNFAIDNELTTAYPFRRFKIRQEETPHRALSVQQLQRLATIQCEPYQVIYRDFFFLSFFLIGINPIDLLHLTASDIHNGRIEYRRSKTHKPYSVKIEPESLALMERYSGTKYLLSPLDSNADYHNWLRRCNDALKKIGDLQRVGRGGKKIHSPIEPQLTMYWARHTWATLAASLDIPKETIAAALGHELGNPVTSIYIRFDQRKVDQANRRVIDFFLNLLK